MSTIASVVVRRPVVVIAVWVVCVAACATVAPKLSGNVKNGGYEVPGSASALARQVQQRHLGGGTDLFVALTAVRPDALAPAVAELGGALDRRPEVGRVGAPAFARAGTVALLPVRLRIDLGTAQKRLPAVRRFVAAHLPAGVHAAVLGEPAVLERYSNVARDDLSRAERVSLPITGAILLLAFLSFIAAGAPMTLALMSLTVTFGVLYGLSRVSDLSVFVTNTALTLGLGLSIDFALFLVTRYREFLRDPSATPEDAVRATIETTGRAVTLSGVTVALSLSGLYVVGVGLFTSMALGASLAALVAVAAAITLVPACLCLFGRRIDMFSLPVAVRAAERGRLWRLLGRVVIEHRWAVVVVALALMVALTVPLLGAHTQVRTLSELPSSDPVRQQTDRLAATFGAGALAPIEVVTTAPAARARATLEAVPSALAVAGPIAGSGGWSELDVIVPERPDTAQAERAVRVARAALPRLGGTSYVGGATAQALDLKRRIDARTPAVIAITLAIAALLLVYGLRSIVVPLKAIVTTLLSAGATLGVLTLVFDDIGGRGGLSYFVPIFVFTIVFGLSVDYEVFLLSRIREEYLAGHDNDEAIRVGLLRSGRSITLAGLILITVFAAFGASSLASFQELGTGMAVAVALDVTLVRSLLVPATLAVLGDRNWWLPRRLPRLLRARATGVPR